MPINSEQHAILDAIVFAPARRAEAVAALRRYFRQPADGVGLYRGRWFERLDGGGDRPHVHAIVTPADVLALSLLSIDVRNEIVLDILEARSKEISDLLWQIPTKLLHEVEYAVLAEGSPAWQLWSLIKGLRGGQNNVTAYKLLARKRPHLLPVYDSVVCGQLKHPKNVWDCLWSWFHDNTARTTALQALRAEVEGIDDISLLRCLDVVLWMRGQPSS